MSIRTSKSTQKDFTLSTERAISINVEFDVIAIVSFTLTSGAIRIIPGRQTILGILQNARLYTDEARGPRVAGFICI